MVRLYYSTNREVVFSLLLRIRMGWNLVVMAPPLTDEMKANRREIDEEAITELVCALPTAEQERFGEIFYLAGHARGAGGVGFSGGNFQTPKRPYYVLQKCYILIYQAVGPTQQLSVAGRGKKFFPLLRLRHATTP